MRDMRATETALSVLWLLLVALALATPVRGASRSSARSAAPSPTPRARRCPAPPSWSSTRRPACRARVETDAEGRYEAANLRPGTYRVEVVTTNFKKVEQTGVVVRDRRHRPRRRQARARRGDRDGDRLRRGRQQHHAREPGRQPRPRRAAAPRPAAQQPRHPGLPAAEPERPRRHRRHPVPGRPDLRRVLRPGRPGLDQRHLRHRRQLRPRPRRHRRDPGALELLQRRVRRPGRRGRHHEARRQQLPRHRVLRLQQRRPERPDLQPEAGGRRARRPNVRHPRAPLGGEPGRPAQEQQDLLLRELRGLERQGDLRRRPRQRPHGGHARRRLPRHDHHRPRSAHGPAVPGQRDPGGPHRPDGARGSWTSSTRCRTSRHAFERLWACSSSSSRRPATATAPTSASTTRPAKNDSLFLRGSYQHRDPSSIQFEAGNALTNLRDPRSEARHRVGHRGLDEDLLSRPMVNEFRVGYNYDRLERQSNFMVAEVDCGSWASRTRPASARTGRASRRSSSRAARRTVPPTSRTAAGTRTARSSRTRSRSATT